MPRTIAIALAACMLGVAHAQTPCCEPHAGAGCLDSGCSDQVCLIDPWCCQTQWDARCATEAGVLCEGCHLAGPCVPPPTVLTESEPCGVDSGDPCGPVLAVVAALPWDTALSGTLWADDLHRDVDRYRIELAEASRVQVQCWSSGPAGIAIIDTGCPPTVHAEGPDGCPATIDSCLAAGSYLIVVRPLLFDALPCGEARGGYVLRASHEPCTPSTPANDRRTDALTVGEGVWAFDSTEASTDPDPLPSWCDEGAGLAISHDLWFRFVPPRADSWTIGTCGSAGWDTRLAVYAEGGSLPLACSDDACDGDSAQLQLPLEAGETLLIRIGGWGHGADAALSIGAASSTACPGDLDLDGQVDAADISVLLILFGSGAPQADLDGSGVVDSGDLGLLLIRMGPCATSIRKSILSEKRGELDWPP